MGITASGIGSGIDIGSIVQQLVAVEGQPRSSRIDRKEARYQVELSSYGQLSAAIGAFDLDGLTDPTDLTRIEARSGDADLFSVTADNEAAPGTYDITVTKLAKSHKIASGSFADPTDVVGTGTLTIELGTYDAPETTFTPNSGDSFDIDIDATNNTLEGVRDAINAADAGVRATIVNDGSGYRLLMSSDKTGAENGISITVSDDDANNTDAAGLSQLAFDATTKNMSTTAAAQDAVLKIDGLDVTSASNSLTEAVSGLTIELKGEGSSSITVSETSAALKNEINKFVAMYNGLAQTLEGLTAYNQDTQTGGPLLGDATARTLETQMRSVVTSVVKLDDGTTLTLAELGITTREDGTLKVDDSKVDEMLRDNYADVVSIFSAKDDGVAVKMEALVDRFTGVGGMLTARTDGIEDSIDQLGDDRAALADRMTKLEARLIEQFTNMDILVSTLQSESAYLQNALSNLPKINTGNNR